MNVHNVLFYSYNSIYLMSSLICNLHCLIYLSHPVISIVFSSSVLPFFCFALILYSVYVSKSFQLLRFYDCLHQLTIELSCDYCMSKLTFSCYSFYSSWKSRLSGRDLTLLVVTHDQLLCFNVAFLVFLHLFLSLGPLGSYSFQLVEASFNIF